MNASLPPPSSSTNVCASSSRPNDAACLWSGGPGDRARGSARVRERALAVHGDVERQDRERLRKQSNTNRYGREGGEREQDPEGRSLHANAPCRVWRIIAVRTFLVLLYLLSASGYPSGRRTGRFAPKNAGTILLPDRQAPGRLGLSGWSRARHGATRLSVPHRAESRSPPGTPGKTLSTTSRTTRSRSSDVPRASDSMPSR